MMIRRRARVGGETKVSMRAVFSAYAFFLTFCISDLAVFTFAYNVSHICLHHVGIAHQELIHLCGCASALGYCPDHKRLTAVHVTCCKYLFNARIVLSFS